MIYVVATKIYSTYETKKYTALKGNIAHAFHVGSNTYLQKDVCKKPSQFVGKI